jgi:hypothetical protein
MEIIQHVGSELRFLTDAPGNIFGLDKYVYEYYWEDVNNVSTKENNYLEMISVYFLLFYNQLILHDPQKLIDNMTKYSLYNSESIRCINMYDFPSEDDFPIRAFHLSLNCRWRRWVHGISDDNIIYKKEGSADIVKYFESFCTQEFEELPDRTLFGVSINTENFQNTKVSVKLDHKNLGLCFVEEHDLVRFMRYAGI